MVTFINLASSIVVTLEGKPVSLDKASDEGRAVLEVLRRNGTEAEVQEAIFSVRGKVEAAIDRSLNCNLKIQGGVLLYQDEPMESVLSDMTVNMAREGFDLQPMVLFCESLMRNPDYRVTQQLMGFLVAGKIAITARGSFMVYKYVNDDFYDAFTGKTFLNTPGSVITMPRNRVNNDPTQTCSHGLHVCSFAYLPNYARGCGRVMACEVFPEHVVSIPTDYNNTKMRVCQYRVDHELTDMYKAQIDVLGNTSVYASGQPFVINEVDEFGNESEVEGFDTLVEAAKALDSIAERCSEDVTLQLVNTVTDVIVDERQGTITAEISSDSDKPFVINELDEYGNESEVAGFDSLMEAEQAFGDIAKRYSEDTTLQLMDVDAGELVSQRQGGVQDVSPSETTTDNEQAMPFHVLTRNGVFLGGADSAGQAVWKAKGSSGYVKVLNRETGVRIWCNY